MRDGAILPLIRSLEKRDVLTDPERAALEQLPLRMREVAAGTEMVGEASEPLESILLLDGYTARASHLRTGERQITGLNVAGDFIDLHSLLLKVMDHSVIALTDCEFATVEHKALRALSALHPHLWRMLMTTIAIDAAIQRIWIVDLGRNMAARHMARLMCELYLRLEVVGKARDMAFRLPITQMALADVLGLSIVHTNRSLQQLRASGAIDWQGGTVHIHDWDYLADFGGFDPLYLNMVKRTR